jgi:hypothetical protein
MRTIAYLFAGLFAAYCLSSCATEYKKTTYPDGRIVEERTETIDAAAFTAGANAVTVIAAPRVRAEK